ncbi:MAG: hypothetical protein R3Y26_08515 [Rikenellaceae bacterium]
MNFRFFKSAVSKVCLAAMLAVAFTALVSCDNEMVTGDVDPEKPTMVGLWRGVSFDVDNNDNWIDITSDPNDLSFG